MKNIQPESPCPGNYAAMLQNISDILEATAADQHRDHSPGIRERADIPKKEA